jgi:dinuclear metal center YbgI/SA1388 family protein
VRLVASRDEIIDYLDELLDAAAFEDYGPNGLQVIGAAEVSTVVTGVSAHLELFERGAAEGAQMVLCHHGMLWHKQPLVVDAQRRARLEALFAADMSLAAYHLPLDAHPEVGNNALICEQLQLRRGEPFGHARGRPIGFVGHADEPIALEALAERCCSTFGRDPLVFEGDGRPLHRVGIVSGGGGSSLPDAIRLGLDAFVTGEPEEPVMAAVRESGVGYLACGHYATETFGVRRLGALLSERFGVQHTFVEIPNPI